MTLTIFYYNDVAELRNEYSILVNKLADEKSLLLHELFQKDFSITVSSVPTIYTSVTEAYIFEKGEHFYKIPELTQMLTFMIRKPTYLSQLRKYGVNLYLFVPNFGSLHKRILMYADKIVDPQGNIYTDEEIRKIIGI